MPKFTIGVMERHERKYVVEADTAQAASEIVAYAGGGEEEDLTVLVETLPFETWNVYDENGELIA